MEKKLWYYGKSDTMPKFKFTIEKTMVLRRKLWYYGETYGTIINYSQI